MSMNDIGELPNKKLKNEVDDVVQQSYAEASNPLGQTLDIIRKCNDKMADIMAPKIHMVKLSRDAIKEFPDGRGKDFYKLVNDMQKAIEAVDNFLYRIVEEI